MEYTTMVEVVLNRCRQEAKKLGNEIIDIKHLIISLIKEGVPCVLKGLQECNIDPDMLEAETLAYMDSGGSLSDKPDDMFEITISDRLSNVINKAVRLADKMKADYVEIEHLTWAMFSYEDVLADLMKEIHQRIKQTSLEMADVVNYKQILIYACEESLAKKYRTPKVYTPVLDQYSTDLADKAGRDYQGPIVGRDAELTHIRQVLLKRRANNPILVGEHGVGKTSIVAALARSFASFNGPIPLSLVNKRVLQINLSLIAGETVEIGQFFQRINSLLKELRTLKREVILFIPDLLKIEQLKNITRTMDIGALLRNALTDGNIQIISVATPEEYEALNKSRTFHGLLTKVTVEGMGPIATKEALIQGKTSYEQWHNVFYPDQVIDSIVQLCFESYQLMRYPQFAFDILDELGSRANAKRTLLPDEISALWMELEEIRNEKNKIVRNRDFETAVAFRSRELILMSKLKVARADVDDGIEKAPYIVTEEDIRSFFEELEKK